MENTSLRDKIRNSKLNSAMKNWVGAAATFFTMAVACPNFASAQNLNEKDDAKIPGTEQLAQPISNDVDSVKDGKFDVKLGIDNFCAIGLNENGCYLYNDLAPYVGIGAEKNGWYGNLDARWLFILNAYGKGYNFTPVSSAFLLELGKEISYKNGNDSGKFSLILGRENIMGGDQLFNGVNINRMSIEERYMAIFGNGGDRIVLSYKDSKGIKAELGIICNKGDGWLVIPNPKEADLWARVGANVLANHKDMDLKVVVAGRMGQQDELHGNVSFKDNEREFGIAAGVNYGFNKNEMAAYFALIKGFGDGSNFVLQSLYNKGEVVLTGAYSKNNIDVFAQVGLNTNKTKVSEPTVNSAKIGISYNFNKNIKLPKNRSNTK